MAKITMQNSRTYKYAKLVLNGRIVACEAVKEAAHRFLDELKASKKGSYPFEFNNELAEHYISVMELFKHSKGRWKGQTLELELWQSFIVGNIFGWIDKKSRYRRFTEAYVEVARKNGKSTKAAGIGNIGLMFDDEGGAEIYSAATKRDQAKIIFNEAKSMIEQIKSGLPFQVDTYKNNISFPGTYSKFEPLSSDTKTMDGLNVHFGIIDEYHAHESSAIYDLVKGGMGSRTQPLLFTITTAGFDTGSACFEKRTELKKILNGTYKPGTPFVDRTFVIIYELDKDDDPFDPEVWIKANPNLGVSKTIQYMQSLADAASKIPSAYADFLVKHCNIWLNASEVWLDMKRYMAAEIETIEVDEEEKCIVGVDLSAVGDLTSVAFLFPGDPVKIKSISFIPEEQIEKKREKDNIPIHDWIAKGLIIPTPGWSVDYEWVIGYIKNFTNEVSELAVDPWNAHEFNRRMLDEGFEVIEVNQSISSLSPATKDFERMLLEGKIEIEENPVLRWAVSNAVAVRDPNDNIKLSKKKSTKRIDPIVAVITGWVRLMATDKKSTRSIYEDRGVRSI